MGVLLIGCGYWGRNWGKTLHGLGELTAICEGNTTIHGELHAAYPGVTLYADLTNALNHANLNGAIVATPVATHAAVAHQCLQAGLPTLVEKPLTVDVAEAEMLAALAKQYDLPLAVGHICLFYPAMAELKQWLREGKLGDLHSVTCVRQKLGVIRNEENVWWSFAPHDCSMLLDLLDNAPLQVQSVAASCDLGRNQFPNRLEDAVTANFITETGISATIQVSWLSPTKQFETIAVGTKGIARIDHAGPGQTLTFTPHQLEKSGQNVTLSNIGQPETLTWKDLEPPLVTQAKAFLNHIRTRTPLPNTAENGLNVVRMLAEVDTHLKTQANSTSPNNTCPPKELLHVG